MCSLSIPERTYSGKRPDIWSRLLSKILIPLELFTERIRDIFPNVLGCMLPSGPSRRHTYETRVLLMRRGYQRSRKMEKYEEIRTLTG